MNSTTNSGSAPKGATATATPAPNGITPSPTPAPNGIAIEPMALSMLPEVLAIDALCYPIPWTREAYEAELSRPADRFYVVARLTEPEKQIVGHGGVAFEEGEAHITTLTVAPDFQGSGIGARLLLALTLAARRHKSRLSLEVAVDNPAAQALYRRFGLAPVGINRGYYTNMGLPPDAVVMRADNIDRSDYANRLIKIAIELDCA